VPMRKEVTGDLMKVHIEESRDTNSSPLLALQLCVPWPPP
jgi:hypothetical protein